MHTKSNESVKGWKVISSVTTVVSREDVVAAFDEETVAKWERDMLLGVDYDLTKITKTPNRALIAAVRFGNLVRRSISRFKKIDMGSETFTYQIMNVFIIMTLSIVLIASIMHVF